MAEILSIADVEKKNKDFSVKKIINTIIDGVEYDIEIENSARLSRVIDMASECSNILVRVANELSEEEMETFNAMQEDVMAVLSNMLFIKYFTNIEGFEDKESVVDLIGFYIETATYLIDKGVNDIILGEFDDGVVNEVLNLFYEKLNELLEMQANIFTLQSKEVE